MNNKILQISFGDGYAGSAKMAVLSSVLLNERGWDAELIASENSLTTRRGLESGLKVHSFNTNVPFKDLISGICDIYNKIQPAIVICHHSLDRKVGIQLRKKYKKTFINIAYRHNMSKSAPIIGSIIYNIYYDFSIACSNGVAKSLTSSGISSKKVKVIHYGIEIPANINGLSGKEIKDKYNLNDKTVIGLSAWFHKERKGFDILFKAFAKLNDKFALFIIGIPAEKQQEVFNYAAEFGIPANKIIMPGYVDDIYSYYKAMDIFVFPSRSEGFPIAPLEAAAASLPIISSDIPGSNEFIFNNKTGILFNVEDYNSFYNHIITLSENITLRNKLAAEANKSVNENYTIRNYGDNIHNFLTIINKPK